MRRATDDTPNIPYLVRAAGCALALLVLLGACARDDGDSERPRDDYEEVQSAVERLSSSHPEATDTAVRDSVLIAVYCSVVHDEPVPADFGMFSAEGDRAVRSVVVEFVQRARVSTAGMTQEERIEFVFGDSWRTDVYVRRDECDRR